MAKAVADVLSFEQWLLRNEDGKISPRAVWNVRFECDVFWLFFLIMSYARLKSAVLVENTDRVGICIAYRLRLHVCGGLFHYFCCIYLHSVYTCVVRVTSYVSLKILTDDPRPFMGWRLCTCSCSGCCAPGLGTWLVLGIAWNVCIILALITGSLKHLFQMIYCFYNLYYIDGLVSTCIFVVLGNFPLLHVL